MSRYILPANIVGRRIKRFRLPEWRTAVIGFQGYDDSIALVEMLSGEAIRRKIFSIPYFPEYPNVFDATIHDQSLCVLISFGVRADILIEELAYLGVQVVIGVGAAGSIDAELSTGMLVAAATAIPNDGASKIYGHGSLRGDCGLIEALERVVGSVGGSVQPVCAATVEALYREEEDLLQRWRDIGAQIINMEVSPFYAASASCGVRSLWLGYVSDRLINGEWESWRGEYDHCRQKVNRTVVELLHESIVRGRW